MNGMNIPMNNRLLLDTNIIIYYFNGLIRDKQIDTIFNENFNISIITKIEFLSWNKLWDNKMLNAKALAFLSHANIYELTDEIANKAINIRQQNKIKTPDAIIAATALVHGFDILTNNIDDFKNLDLRVSSVEIDS